MANTIITKNSSTASAVPTSGDLVQGELAVNVTDKRLFTEDSGGNVVEVGTNPSTMAVAGNATVGGTLGVTGVATLTANPVLSAGTANGLAFLNASKVLTSGSALTFNGTNLGIGTSSPAAKLHLSGTGATDAKIELQSGTGVASADGRYGNLVLSSDEDNAVAGSLMAFKVDGTERLRIDSSGNVGIGTSSPSAKLDVNGTIYSRTGGVYTDTLTAYSGSSISVNAGSSYFAVTVNSAERLRIDSSGNLGLGVTPSAWGVGSAFDLSATGNAAYISSNAGLIIGANYYNNGSSNIYKSSAYSGRYYINSTNGQHQWFTAPSGTAGTAISFTQAMTLDASGRLGIGTSSPSGLLTLNAASASAQLYIRSGDSNDAALIFGGQTDGATASIAFYHSDNSLRFNGYNNTERARIDSSGNLLVGTTSSSAASKDTRLSSVYPSTLNGLLIRQTGSTASSYAILFENSNGTIGTVVTSGSTTTYNTSSDYRLKNTIAPMTGALAKVAALKPCTYKWNADGSDGEGFIAHELAEVVPQCVTGEKDAVDADGNPVYQGIDTSFLVATLTAAIQELKAEFDAYKASHP